MKPPADGWDRDEVEALAPFEQELEAIRARHQLVTEHDKARLLRRIRQEAGPGQARASIFWTRPWLLATAASVVIVAGAFFLLRDQRRPVAPAPDRAVATVTPPVAPPATPPAPQFLLALAKPDLKVSPAALTYRRASGENRLLAALKPGFDAFRANDYAAADRAFTTLAPEYPKSVEVFFYQGVARLFLDDARGALASLAAAAKVDDGAFAWDIEWYRAVAEERTGDRSAARHRLTRLCQRADTRAPQACDAAKTLPSGR